MAAFRWDAATDTTTAGTYGPPRYADSTTEGDRGPRVVVIVVTDPWTNPATTAIDPAVLAAMVDRYVETGELEKDYIGEPREPVPRGARPVMESEPVPRSGCEPYRVNRPRPPPRVRPAPAGLCETFQPSVT